MTEARPLDNCHKVLRAPQLVAEQLMARYPLLGAIELVAAKIDFVSFELVLKPYVELISDGYTTETVRISVLRNGNIFAIPIGPERKWKHRFPEPLRQLCLWYPDDPPALKWEWPRGLVDYVAVVHRHLLGEEYWRRTGTWPGEDAPHDWPTDGPHPIRSLPLRLRAGLVLS